MRHLSLTLVVLLLGCGQGADSRRDSGRDGATDLGSNTQPDGTGSPDASARQDRAPDRGSPPDRESSPDLPADIGASFDKAGDAGTAVDGPRASADGPADGGCALANSISVDKLPQPLEFDAYHSQQEVTTYLQAVASAMPAVAQYRVLGQSVQGRDVPYLVINATCQANPPAIFANGAHHGDEPSSTEAVVSIPDHLLRASTTEPSVRSLLSAYAFYVLPLVNPDGRALNTRENANGADINRDYSYPGRSDASSFKTAEALLIKSLQDGAGFHAAIAYHSGAQEVVWPWCYTGDATADDTFFTAAGKRATQAMGFSIYQQSYDDYPTQGEYIDYAYWKNRTLATTFEVSQDKTPSAASLAGVVDGAWKGTLAWFQAVSDHDKGSLHGPKSTPAARARFPLTAPFDGTNRLE
jgi:predicted deacylase